MNISVIGAGCVGLTTAACLAELGHTVFCTDSDREKLDQLRQMKIPFFEPHLAKLVEKNILGDKLHFVDQETAIRRSGVLLICVGTPPLPNGNADISAIESVAVEIVRHGQGHLLVVEKSTVPVQTAQLLKRYFSLHEKDGLNVDVASNPEFLREGSAIEDFFHPDRIVVGANSEKAFNLMRDMYQPILDGRTPCPIHSGCTGGRATSFLTMDTNSAELVKHASNSFLAMKISFINMIADLSEATGANIRRVAEGLGLDRRIGPAFLRPGIGFGGFCFPKDLRALICMGESHGCDFSLLKEVEKVNVQRVESFVAKIEKELRVFRGKIIAVWGIAFKPNTDDVRCSPSVEIIRRLIGRGAQIRAYDPRATKHLKAMFPEAMACCSLYDAAQGSDAILLLTEWEEFRSADWPRLATMVNRPLVFDGRNSLSAEAVTSAGFRYLGIGHIQPQPLTSEMGAFEEVAAGSTSR
jgi:UDPglucose 6-dehydrogenase